jgi:hypothetical protein
MIARWLIYAVGLGIVIACDWAMLDIIMGAVQADITRLADILEGR